MAGGGSAYVRLERLDNNISQGLQYWGGIAAQEKAAKKLADEREAVRKAQERKEMLAKFDYDETTLDGVMVGQKDFDAVTRTYAENTVNKVNELTRLGQEALDSGNLADYRKYLGMSKKVQSSMRNWNKYAEKIDPWLKDYMAKANNGTLNPFDPRHKIYDALLKYDYVADFDENGNPTLIIKTEEDRDGDGEITEKDYLNIDPFEIFDGSQQVFQQVDLGAETKKIADELGIDDIQSVQGDYIFTDKGWNIKGDQERTNQLNTMIFSNIIGNKEKMSWALHNASKWRGDEKAIEKIDDFTKEDEALVSEYIGKMILGKVDVSHKEDVRGQTQSERKAEIKDKQAHDKKMLGMRQAFQKQLQDDAQAAAMEQLKLRLANQGSGSGRKPTKEELEMETKNQAMMRIWEIADELKNADTDKKAQEILDKYRTGIKVNDGFWNWWDRWDAEEGNAIDINDKTINVNNTNKLAKTIAKDMGVEYDPSYVLSVVEGKIGSPTNTTPITPEDKGILD